MTIVTKENYFDHNNHALHQSSIKDYFLCPNYFYRKNVLQTVEQPDKKAFQIGKVVDDILTETDSVDNYAIFEGDRRTKEGKADYQALQDAGKKVISQKDYDNIINICDAIYKTTAYKEIFKSYNRQEILQMPMDLGEHFDSLVGKVDFFTIDENGICHLNDMKTTRSIDDNKFFYACREYGYFFQLFVYSLLLNHKYPEIKGFSYSILAGETAEPYRVKYFKIPNSYVEKEADRYLYAIKSIKDGLYDKEDASLQNPTLLCDPKDREELQTEGDF